MNKRKPPRKAGRPAADKVMVSRRISRPLWERLQAYAAGLKPVATDTAVLELALDEFLTRAGA
jgi:hypothetical protein